MNNQLIGTEALAEVEALLNVNDDTFDQKTLSDQYHILLEKGNEALELITLGDTPYFLTAKPLDDAYYKRNHFDFHRKGLDKVLSKLRSAGITQYAGSTELYAMKVHHNVIFRCNSKKVLKWHNEVWFHKWKIYCKPVERSVELSLSYIYKEALQRHFAAYWDYSMKFPKPVIEPKAKKRDINSDFIIDIV